MSEKRDNGGDTPRYVDRRGDEVEKRGGYMAPVSPFRLPRMPGGPAQGAQTTPSGGEPTPPPVETSSASSSQN